MIFKKILNVNVRNSLANEVDEPYVLSKKGTQIVYDYNENLPQEYFELLKNTGFREIKIVPFGFLVAIFNEPTSFILSKITGKSMQPDWYWALFGFLDRALFFWLPTNWHSHFIIIAKK